MGNSISTTGGRGEANGIATGIDWGNVDYDSAEGRKELGSAISDYFRDLRKAAPVPSPAGMAGLKTTRPGHLPGALPDRPDVDVRFYGPAEDAGVLSLFRYVDKRASKNPVFQFANVNAGSIVFEQSRPGQPARIRRVEGGTPTPLASVTWHGAIGIDDDARRFDDYGIYEQNVQAVPAKWLDKQAELHATLVSALGSGINESWSTDLITTLNNGGAKILEDAGDVYGLSDSPTFALLYNHRDWVAVHKALASNFTLANDNNSANALQWDIQPIKTRKIASGSMYLCIPGHDMVSVEWDELYAEFGRDFERGVDAMVWRARLNAAIGNVQQVRRITPQ